LLPLIAIYPGAYEKSEDIKGVIRSRNVKRDRQCIGQKNKGQTDKPTNTWHRKL